MKKLIALTIPLVLAACSGPLVNLSTLNTGMTKTEVIRQLGQPESARAKDGVTYLYFKVHDHAFDRDKNHYLFAFSEEKLVEFAPLPEEGPIDAIIRRAQNRSSQPANSGTITTNAFGPGLHMDQFGRPVRVVPQ